MCQPALATKIEGTDEEDTFVPKAIMSLPNKSVTVCDRND